jgi:multidrug efflux pump subunit AcrA (membrane-fusion protein)
MKQTISSPTLGFICAWAATLSVVIALPTFAGSPSSVPEKKSDTPPTYTIVRGALKSKVQLDAVVEAVDMAPVKLETKAWTDLTVLEAAPHGARVKKGDLLIRLDTEKLKDQIDDLEQDRPASAVALELTQAEWESLMETMPLKLESAKRLQRQSAEDMAYFEKTGRSLKEKGAAYNLKGAEQRLEGAKEELAQLEKMYKADDLTEETEEIILKRQRFAVEFATFGLESTRQSTEQSLKTSIPREYETLKSQKRDQELALALAEQTLPKTLTKKKLDLEKAKRDSKKSEKKLADFKRDLELAVVRAPMDGIVYYGACENGKWLTGAAMTKKLLPSGKLSANEVFITVVNPEKLVLKSVVPESDLSQVKVGLEGKAAPVAAPDSKFPVRLEQLGDIPLPAGGFEARLSFEKGPNGLRLVPGMNCKVNFGEPKKTDALVAPKDAVFMEGKQAYVFIAKGDEKPEKRKVKTGESDGKMIQLLSGVSDGDKILSQKPE